MRLKKLLTTTGTGALALAMATGLGLVGSQPTAQAATPDPIVSITIPPTFSARSTAVPSPGATPSATATSTAPTSTTIAALPPQDTQVFSMAGVSWQGDPTQSPTVSIRTKANGVWSAWTALERDSYRGTGRQGTDAAFLGSGKTGIEVKVDGPVGTTVSDLKIMLINTDALSSPTSPAPSPQVTATAQAGGLVPMPTMITRAQWGARAPQCAMDNQDKLQGVIVHHTAGTNSYTATQSAGILRGDQAYHMDARGWCDLGYNVVIDKYGQVFEGRAGSLNTPPVKGVHAGPGNYRGFGISVIGNSETWVPGSTVYDKIARVSAWRLSQYGLSAYGKATYYNSSTGVTYNVGTIAGHREVMSTACPGANIWANMGNIRSRTAALIAAAPPAPAPAPTDGLIVTAPASTIYGNTPLKISGKAYPAVAGRLVTARIYNTAAAYLANGGTVPQAADGSFTVDATYRATQPGTYRYAAGSVYPDGKMRLSALSTVARSKSLTWVSTPSAATAAGTRITLKGKLTPGTGAAGRTVTIEGSLNNGPWTTYTTALSQTDGTVASWPNPAAGTWRFRLREDAGWTAYSPIVTVVRTGVVAPTVTLNTPPSAIYGNTKLVLTGRAAPAIGGRLVTARIYNMAAGFTAIGGTVPQNADGTFTVDATYLSTKPGSWRYAVGSTYPDGKMYLSTLYTVNRTKALAMTSWPQTTTATGTRFTLKGKLNPGTGAGGRPVVLEASLNGGAWSAYTSTTAAADGSVAFWPNTAKGTWRFRIREDSAWTAYSPAVTVTRS